MIENKANEIFPAEKRADTNLSSMIEEIKIGRKKCY